MLTRLVIVLVTVFGAVACYDASLDSGAGSGPGLGPHSSKPVRVKLQKAAAVFFGCAPLTPASATLKCTNRIQKLTDGVQCSTKVPLGTTATFTCNNNFKLSDPAITKVKCRFPGKWVGKMPTCVPIPTEPTTVATDPPTTKGGSAVAVKPPAKEAPASGATAAKEAPAASGAAAAKEPATTAEPLLLPIAVKNYGNVGTLSGYDADYEQDEARQFCKKEADTNLLFINSGPSKQAAIDLFGLMEAKGVVVKNIWTDVELDGGAYKSSKGVELLASNWCPGEPVKTDECTLFSNTPGTDYYHCYNSVTCTGLRHQFICRKP